MELGYVLFDNGGHEHDICRQDFVFFALEFVVVLGSACLSGGSDTSIAAYLIEGDVWVLVVVVVKL